MKQINRIILLVTLLISISLLSACNPFSYTKRMGLEDQVTENNQKGYDLVERGEYEKAITYLDKAVEYIYKLEPSLVNLDHEIELSELMDSPFNNLSWAYNEKMDFEKGLEYANKSLLILPNSDVEYVNKGNALYGLYRYDEALVQYDQAISLEKNDKSAYYGKGMIYYDRHQYQEAIDEFDTYLSLDDTDIDAMEMKIYSYMDLGDTEQALSFAEDLIKRDPTNYETYRIKATVIENTGELADIKKYFESMIEKFPDEMDIYVQMIKAYSAIGELEQAKASYAKAVKKDKSYVDLYTTMGDIYSDHSLYVEAVEYYDQAVQIDPLDEDFNINNLQSLYNSKRNLRCAAFGEKAGIQLPTSADIAWYTGQCNFELENYSEAIDNFGRAVEIDPDDDESYANMAYAYLMLEDNDKAEEYSEKSLNLYADNSTANYVKNAIQEKQKPLGKQISKFFRDDYLYQDSSGNLDKTLAKLDEANLTNKDIADVIERVKKPDDWFTFTIYGDEYDQLTAETGSDIKYEDQGDIAYFRIYEFAGNTDDKFTEMIDQIPDPEKKVLVLDLRHNSGGRMDSSNHMLDVLLPEVVTSALIDKQGYTDNYYSDASHIDFKKVYILVDEYTASAAELLTLGLKTYLNNVTVVGRDTFGKGVGQEVFEDKKNKIMVFVINFYWNVRQNNIMYTGIKPDIYIKSDKLADYMKVVHQ